MKIHHGKHHKAYIDNLNKALGDEKRNLGAILKNIKQYPDAVRNNAGGHWNHSFFWTLLTPIKENQTLPETLNKKIAEQFGSLEDFKKKFEQAGLSQFGSGWVWLIVNRRGKLEITTTPNQDNPLMPVASIRGIPILAIDVWEHAYYLKYQNQRGSYLNQIWNIVNWKQVNEYYEEAIKL
jgi:Fe-Mn family superoxide dismutase